MKSMDTFEAIQQSLPKTALMLNAAGTAYVDVTNRGVTFSGTPSITGAGLVSGSTKSVLLTGGTAINIPTTIFTRGQEKRQFTLEAAVLPHDLQTEFISILSHDTVEDGLYIKGNEIRFTVEFSTLGTVTAAFPIPTNYESYLVQGVYNQNKLQLYVNGYLYDEKTITDEQKKDGFKSRASSNLYSGQGSALGKRVSLDAVAVYGRSLTDAEAYLHYLSSNYVVDHATLAQAFGGAATLDGGANSRNIVFNKEWSPDWSDDATTSFTSVQDNRLVPEVDYTTQASLTGTWIAPFNIDGWPAIYGVMPRWTGTGSFVVEASLDGGTTWVTASNGSIVTGTYNLDTTDVKPLIRVTFTGGVVGDTSNLSQLSVTVYGDGLVYTTDATRALTASTTTTTWDRDFEPIERGVRKGASLPTGPFILPADVGSTDPSTFQTVETWVMFDGTTTGQYVYDLRPGVTNGYLWISGINFAWATGTVYINGAVATTGTTPLVSGKWNHIVHVLPAAQNTDIRLGTGVASTRITYAVFNLHPTALTAADALTLFRSYHDYPTARLAAESNPVTEGAVAYKIYQNDWALTETGV